MKRDDDVARPLGRPRCSEPKTPVTTWLRPREHDQLIKLANERETPVSTLVRQLLVPKLPR